MILAEIVQGLVKGVFGQAVEAYKAKLASGDSRERIAAELAEKDLSLRQRERELAISLAIQEEGRWWTALPRAMVTYAGAFYVCKVVIWDTCLGWGTTPAIRGDVAEWLGWLMALWFGGRTLEKVAGKFARR